MADKSEPKLLTEDSDEVTKDDYKALHRVFPELGRESRGRVNETDINNALVNIIKNRTKLKDNPLTEREIREMATNPAKRLGNREEDDEEDRKTKNKKSPLYDHPRSKK